MTNGKHLLWFVALILLLFSCRDREKINYNDIVGEYYNGIDSTDYNYFIFRKDCTYFGNQSPQYSDIWFSYHGRWEIKGDILILYKGVDVSNNLKVTEVVDPNSDTLIINIGNELLKAFPTVRFSIDEDTSDLRVNNGCIVINKNEYWDTTRTFHKDFKYLPIELKIRLGNCYADLYYIFENREMTISLNNTNPIQKSDTILCKYEMRNGVLFSFDEFREIRRNDLKK